MKKLLLRGVLCLALMGIILPVYSATRTAVPKLVQIQQKTLGFSVSLPADWEVHQDVEMQGYVIPLTALRPAANNNVFRENIVVVDEKLPSAMTPVEYLMASLKGLSGGLKGFKQLNSGTLKNGNAPSAYMIYTHKMDIDLKVILFFFSKGEKGYTLTCTATPASFSKYLDLFMAIGRSFTP